MKLNFNGYEVEIKAKANYNNRFNKEDTMDLLNMISIWASEAAEHETSRGALALAKSYERTGDEIFSFLDKSGLYNAYK